MKKMLRAHWPYLSLVLVFAPALVAWVLPRSPQPVAAVERLTGGGSPASVSAGLDSGGPPPSMGSEQTPAPAPEPGRLAPPIAEIVPRGLALSAASALIVDDRGEAIYAKGVQQQRPIASITKLMTAMVVLDSGVSLDDPVTILEEDRDQMRHSRSRLRIDEGATLARRDMLAVALVSSDNRAASALGRTTLPGGKPAFVAAMNRKAAELKMTDSRFADPSGLDANNASTAADLVKMIQAAAAYPLIREITTRGAMEVHPYGDARALQYRNTNPLVRSPEWRLELSKTGYINEAGRCLVMRAVIGGRTLSIVLLGAAGKRSPVGDSNRLRKWLELHPFTLSG